MHHLYKPLSNKEFFDKNQLPKLVTGHELQRNYKMLIVHTQRYKKPVFILHYARPDAVLLSYQAWQEVCDLVTEAERIEQVAAICPQCSIVLYGPP